MKNIKKYDLIICAVLSIFLGIFIFELRDITPLARVYPAFVIAGSYIMIAVVAFRAILGNKKKPPAQTASSGEKGTAEAAASLDKTAMIRIIIYCGAILAYILLIDILGYILSTVVFAVFSLLFMRNKNKVVLVALPVIFALAMYFIFANFLFVRLPAGILFSGWGG